jgi:hypothetical protein
MGWTVFQAPPKGGMEAAVLASLSDFGKREIVASNRVGDAVYAAVRVGDQVVGAVGVIDGLGYKLMSEDEVPYYYAASDEVLAALTPTSVAWSQTWRARCRQWWGKE